MSTLAPVIRVSNLTFEYAETTALDDISFEVPTGSITALVGPNGAGKTTLMRCIAGLERPISGTVSVCDVDVLENSVLAHTHVGYLSDFFGLYNDLTVEQSLQYVGACYHIPRLDEVVAKAISDAFLTPHVATRAGDLSRGYRQRLGIAQAIIHSPPVLLLDEPASGLDPEARAELATLLRTLRARGMTILVSSHILAELTEYSTHMLVLRQGRLIDMQEIRPEASTRELLLIELAEPNPMLQQLLGNDAEFLARDIGPDSALGLYPVDRSRQAELLARLQAAGLKVSRYTEVGADMQSKYLDLVRQP